MSNQSPLDAAVSEFFGSELLTEGTINIVEGDIVEGGLTVASGLAFGKFKPIKRQVDKLTAGKAGEANAVVPKGGSKLLKHTLKARFFKGDEAVKHFEKHGSELMGAFGRNSYNLKDYLNDANHVIKNGTFVPEMNGYVHLIGGKGSAKYGFVGLAPASGNITTFHTKPVSALARKAPRLGFSK